jgi:ribosome modulation factor
MMPIPFSTGEMTEERAHSFGYDAGRNKPNETNCHFSIFATPELTRAWERGKKAGDAEREAAAQGPQGSKE